MNKYENNIWKWTLPTSVLGTAACILLWPIYGPAAPNCQNTSTGQVPLYQNSVGHVQANTIPSNAVIAGFGMSNARREYSVFSDILNNAIGGGTVDNLANSNWHKWPRIMQGAGNPNQVTDALLKVAIGGKSNWSQTAYVDYVINSTYGAMAEIRRRFPNVQRFHLWSRIYGEYADDWNQGKSSEPQAYWTGLAVQTVVAQDPNAYHGPYLWADGLNARSDGLTWVCSDFDNDGLHPDLQGMQKVRDWGLIPWLEKAQGGQSSPPPDDPQQCPNGKVWTCKIWRGEEVCKCKRT